MGKELAKTRDTSTAPGLAQFDNKVPVEVGAVAKFLQQRVLRAQRDGTGGKARICIRHTVSGRIGDRVDEAQLAEPETLTEDKVGALALEICKVAANDAENRGRGAQRYTLQWFTFEEPTENPFVLSFEVKTGRQVGGDEDGYVDSYPPTEHGVSSMLIHRLDKFEDVFLEYIGAMVAPMTAMKEMLATSANEALVLRQEIRANAKEVAEAKAAEWQRAEGAKDAEAKRAMWGELTGMIKVVGPALGKRFGLVDPKQPIPADEAHVSALVQSLVEEGKFGWFLSDECPMSAQSKALLIDLAGVHLERLAKLEAEKAGQPGPPKGANGKSNGTVHAGHEPPAAPPPVAAPPTPEQLVKAAEQAEAQAEVWALKAVQLKAAALKATETDAPTVPANADAPAAPTGEAKA